jgi:hypothetical protein
MMQPETGQSHHKLLLMLRGYIRRGLLIADNAAA